MKGTGRKRIFLRLNVDGFSILEKSGCLEGRELGRKRKRESWGGGVTGNGVEGRGKDKKYIGIGGWKVL